MLVRTNKWYGLLVMPVGTKNKMAIATSTTIIVGLVLLSISNLYLWPNKLFLLTIDTVMGTYWRKGRPKSPLGLMINTRRRTKKISVREKSAPIYVEP